VSGEQSALYDEKKEHNPEGVPLEEDEDIDALTMISSPRMAMVSRKMMMKPSLAHRLAQFPRSCFKPTLALVSLQSKSMPVDASTVSTRWRKRRRI
jgi:hypothetical protein